MLKNFSNNLGNMVKSDYEKVGKVSNHMLQSVGLEQTGQFVEEQLIEIGEGTADNIEMTGQALEGAAKTVGGFVMNDADMKGSGMDDLHEVKNQLIEGKVMDAMDTAGNVADVGIGLATGNTHQVKEGVTGLIGLKKSAVALNVWDDFANKGSK